MNLLQVAFLLVLSGGATAMAQQVTPIPVAPTPLISSQTSTACLVGCDTQVMNCQNACVVVGAGTTTTSGVASAAGTTSSCTLNCTTQQLVCKQGCSRPQQ